MKRIKILDANIDVLTMKQTVDIVENYVKEKKSLHLMGVNADKINQMEKDSKLKRIVNECDVINADGASVVIASKILKKPLPERVAGIDLMEQLIVLSEKRGYTVFLLGAKNIVVEQTEKKLKDAHKDLNIVGIHDGYFSEKQWPNIAEKLKHLQPNFIFVGISSPQKEYLIDFLQSQGVNSVLMGVGGSFDVISGLVQRAPIWVQRINMEWLYRMMQEPKRLMRRYLIGNFTFIRNILVERVRHGQEKS